jgi:hypothetical protein
VLRIEIVVESPCDLGSQPRLRSLSQLMAEARARNRRLLKQERVGKET